LVKTGFAVIALTKSGVKPLISISQFQSLGGKCY